MVGTPGSEVIFARVMAAKAAFASNRGSITISPPFSTVRFNTVAFAKTWKKGSTPKIRSSNGSLGAIRSGALERANVDVTEELVALISAQRNFQANAKAIETASNMTQTIVSIR